MRERFHMLELRRIMDAEEGVLAESLSVDQDLLEGPGARQHILQLGGVEVEVDLYQDQGATRGQCRDQALKDRDQDHNRVLFKFEAIF